MTNLKLLHSVAQWIHGVSQWDIENIKTRNNFKDLAISDLTPLILIPIFFPMSLLVKSSKRLYSKTVRHRSGMRDQKKSDIYCTENWFRKMQLKVMAFI